MALTPHAQLRQWLILVLGDLGGSAPRSAALSGIQQSFGHALTEDDVESPKSRPWEDKWANRVSWERDRMVKGGLLAPFEGRGTPWSLTQDGWAIYHEIRGNDDANADDPFAHFKPKDSSDYRARVNSAVITKKRLHEALIADFGKWCISRGFEADTAVHPRDLVVRRDNSEWLVEAKIVYLGHATDAVRAALAQVLMYAHFLGGTPRPSLLALFSESVGQGYVDFLDAHGVASVWAADSGWEGSASASMFWAALLHGS